MNRLTGKEIERQVIAQEIANHQHANQEPIRGQWFAFTIALTAILTTAWLAAHDKDTSCIWSDCTDRING